MKKEEKGLVEKSLKLLAKASFIVFIGILLSKIFTYIYRIAIARYFGPEVYGVFSLAVMLSGFFIAFSMLGLTEGLLRYIPLYRGKREDKKIRYIFRFVSFIVFISGILAGVLLFLLSDFIAINIFHNEQLALFLKIFSIVIPLNVIASPLLVSIRAYEHVGWYSFIYNITQTGARVLFLFVLVLFGLKAESVAVSYTLGSLSMLILAYVVCRYKFSGVFRRSLLEKREKRKISKELWKYSLPLLFFSVLWTIFYWIDSFSIGYFKSATEVGFYNAAVPIALLLGIASTLFVQLFFPLITKEYARKDSYTIKELSKQVGKWIFVINLPLFVLLLVFPGAAINILFGNEYLVAENALRFLSIGAMFGSVFVISQHLLSMAGKSKLVLANVVVAAVLNIILNAILVPIPKIWFVDNALGINGAAIATMISVIIFNLLFMIQAYRHVSVVPVKRKMLSIGLASIIPALLLYYATRLVVINIVSVSVLAVFFVLLYLLFIIAINGLDKNDWMIIKSAKNKVFRVIDNSES